MSARHVNKTVVSLDNIVSFDYSEVICLVWKIYIYAFFSCWIVLISYPECLSDCVYLSYQEHSGCALWIQAFIICCYVILVWMHYRKLHLFVGISNLNVNNFTIGISMTFANAHISFIKMVFINNLSIYVFHFCCLNQSVHGHRELISN